MISSHYDTFSSATEMIHTLRARKISSVELLELHMRRIERYNPALNAVVTLDFENALSTAKQADMTRARGENQMLLGLPITIKDLIDVQGLPTTQGSPALTKAIAQSDASIVRHVRAAGAVILGKTNVPLYGADWQTDNPLFGQTNNPWDLTRTAGGSSGGGACALAAGLSTLDFGNDISGSIRIPAAFCGVYGHKSSEAVLPAFPNTAMALPIQGPLARFAEDLELAFDMITGAYVSQSRMSHLNVPTARHKHLAEYRVAVLPPLKWLPVDDEIMEAQEQFVSKLNRLGMKVKETQPEDFGDLRQFYKLYNSILTAITSSTIPKRTRQLHALVYRMKGDEFSASRSHGLRASAADYITWHAQRELYRAAYRTFFKEWDILLSPVNVVNAFPHTRLPFRKRSVVVNDQKVAYLLQNVYPGLATLCGQPATAFPVGLTRSGLPIGLQAIGPYLEDRTTMRFAALVAQEFGAFQRPKGYD